MSSNSALNIAGSYEAHQPEEIRPAIAVEPAAEAAKETVPLAQRARAWLAKSARGVRNTGDGILSGTSSDYFMALKDARSGVDESVKIRLLPKQKFVLDMSEREWQHLTTMLAEHPEVKSAQDPVYYNLPAISADRPKAQTIYRQRPKRFNPEFVPVGTVAYDPIEKRVQLKITARDAPILDALLDAAKIVHSEGPIDRRMEMKPVEAKRFLSMAEVHYDLKPNMSGGFEVRSKMLKKPVASVAWGANNGYVVTFKDSEHQIERMSNLAHVLTENARLEVLRESSLLHEAYQRADAAALRSQAELDGVIADGRARELAAQQLELENRERARLAQEAGRLQAEQNLAALKVRGKAVLQSGRAAKARGQAALQTGFNSSVQWVSGQKTALVQTLAAAKPAEDRTTMVAFRTVERPASILRAMGSKLVQRPVTVALLAVSMIPGAEVLIARGGGAEANAGNRLGSEVASETTQASREAAALLERIRSNHPVITVEPVAPIKGKIEPVAVASLPLQARSFEAPAQTVELAANTPPPNNPVADTLVVSAQPAELPAAKRTDPLPLVASQQSTIPFADIALPLQQDTSTAFLPPVSLTAPAEQGPVSSAPTQLASVATDTPLTGVAPVAQSATAPDPSPSFAAKIQKEKSGSLIPVSAGVATGATAVALTSAASPDSQNRDDAKQQAVVFQKVDSHHTGAVHKNPKQHGIGHFFHSIFLGSSTSKNQQGM